MTKSEIAAKTAKKEKRAQRREEKKIENAALAGESVLWVRKQAQDPHRTPEDAPGRIRTPVRAVGRRSPAPKKPGRKKSPTMSRLKKKLWEAIRQVVYSWSPLYCQACGQESDPVACHIVPSHEGAATRFFLPNLYRGCSSCNKAEQVRRVSWVTKHEEIFGADYVEALRLMSRGIFDLDRAWVLEQTERMRKMLSPESHNKTGEERA